MDYRSIDTVGGGGADNRQVAHTIFDTIISIENLLAAWREFKRGKMKKAEVQEFSFHLEDNLFALREELLDKIYRPSPYAFFYVRDPKLRPIHKATVKDRVLFQAVFRVLYHIFDKKFIHDSYSCRFEKGAHRGVSRLERFIKKASHNYHREIFALKCDIRQFFYSIDHVIMFNLIRQEIDDPDALDLIFKIIDSFHTEPCKGLPLGNVTSQLFANVYLNELDQYVKHVLKEKQYLRYCDDFIIVNSDQTHLARKIPQLNHFLQEHLELSLHPKKISIRKLSHGIDFLGYVLLPHHRVLRTKTKQRMFKKVARTIENFEKGVIGGYRAHQTVQSYLGLLTHCNGHKLGKRLQNKVWMRRTGWVEQHR